LLIVEYEKNNWLWFPSIPWGWNQIRHGRLIFVSINSSRFVPIWIGLLMMLCFPIDRTHVTSINSNLVINRTISNLNRCKFALIKKYYKIEDWKIDQLNNICIRAKICPHWSNLNFSMQFSAIHLIRMKSIDVLCLLYRP